jgi:leader peptidase (prepilin peptidase)/N-methyltransferase
MKSLHRPPSVAVCGLGHAPVAGERRSIHDRGVFAAPSLSLTVGAVVSGLASGYGAWAFVRRAGRPVSRWLAAALVAGALVVAGAVAWRFDGREWLAPAYFLLALVAVPLAAVDAAEHRIPDVIVKPTFALALLLLAAHALHTRQASPLVRAVLAALVVYAAAFALILGAREAMGWGDGKILAVSALWLGYLGWSRVLEGLLLSFVAAALVAGVLVTRGRRGARLPMAPFLLLGTLVAVLAG